MPKLATLDKVNLDLNKRISTALDMTHHAGFAHQVLPAPREALAELFKKIKNTSYASHPAGSFSSS